MKAGITWRVTGLRLASARQASDEMNGARNRSSRRPSPATRRSGAFTLVELLVIIAIIGVLTALLLPALDRGKQSAWRARCENNLHQLSLAAQMYCDDHAGNCFYYRLNAINGGQTFWFGWLGPGPDEQRPYDLSLGVLFPYLNGSDVRLCPALSSKMAQFKLKATNSVLFSYGCNRYLAPLNTNLPVVNVSKIRRPTGTAMFADAAEVNDFLAPASKLNPLLEEFYYVDLETNYSTANNYPNGHFRHSQRANAAFVDGHVELEKPVPGSFDKRLPGQFVGQLRPEILTVP